MQYSLKVIADSFLKNKLTSMEKKNIETMRISKIGPYGTADDVMRLKRPVWEITIFTASAALQQEIADFVLTNSGSYFL